MNMEAAAVSHGAPSTVTAPAPATAEPPVKAVRARSFAGCCCLKVTNTYMCVCVCTRVHMFPVMRQPAAFNLRSLHTLLWHKGQAKIKPLSGSHFLCDS